MVDASGSEADQERRDAFMRRAIVLARRGMMAGDGGPFGALIVRSGEIIGEGWNRVLATRDPTAHGEMVAIREAYAELFVDLLDEGVRGGEFRVEQVSLVAACLVGAIAEALVGPLSPPARAARDAGLPAADLATVSQALITFCLRAVGAPES